MGYGPTDVHYHQHLSEQERNKNDFIDKNGNDPVLYLYDGLVVKLVTRTRVEMQVKNER